MNAPELTMRFGKVLRSRGVAGTLVAAGRHLFRPRPKTLATWKELVTERRGFEIGGPSPMFGRGGTLPIYPLIAGLDNCNFSARTVWEGAISEGLKFQYDPDRSPGRQYIAEATDLSMIQSSTYDFALSCHSLEHTANPLRALTEWKRILKDGGALLLVVPHKEDSFDHRRPVTKLEHLVDDFKKGTTEDDVTHQSEVLKLHDIDRDWGCSDWKSFEERTRKNSENRCMHQHVFDTSLVAHMLDYLQMQLLSVEALRPFHIIIASRKLPASEHPNNESLLSANAEWRRASPFRIDRERAGNGQ